MGGIGIAEIRRACREGVCPHRNPCRIDHVRARFNQHSSAAGPGDIESELIRMHAKGGVLGLHLRRPDRGGLTTKGRPQLVAPGR